MHFSRWSFFNPYLTFFNKFLVSFAGEWIAILWGFHTDALFWQLLKWKSLDLADLASRILFISLGDNGRLSIKKRYTHTNFVEQKFRTSKVAKTLLVSLINLIFFMTVTKQPIRHENQIYSTLMFITIEKIKDMKFRFHRCNHYLRLFLHSIYSHGTLKNNS